MLRTRSIGPLVALLVVALVTASCGTLADTTAATVRGHVVTIDRVQEMAEDEDFIPGFDRSDESRRDGELVRIALGLEIQRVLTIAELERFDLDLGAAVEDAQDAVAELEQLMQSEGLAAPPQDVHPVLVELRRAAASGMEPHNLRAYTEFLVADLLLSDRFRRLDPEDDEELRRFYDAVPEYWDQTCVAAVQFAGDDVAAVDDALRSGSSVEEVPAAVDGAELIVDPTECRPEVFFDPLGDDFTDATIGETVGPLTIEDGAGGEFSVAFRIDARRRITFDEAQDQLRSMVAGLAQQGAQPWIGLLALDAEVNPRIGSAVVPGQGGSPVIEPPQAPLALRGPDDLLGITDAAG